MLLSQFYWYHLHWKKQFTAFSKEIILKVFVVSSSVLNVELSYFPASLQTCHLNAAPAWRMRQHCPCLSLLSEPFKYLNQLVYQATLIDLPNTTKERLIFPGLNNWKYQDLFLVCWVFLKFPFLFPHTCLTGGAHCGLQDHNESTITL